MQTIPIQLSPRPATPVQSLYLPGYAFSATAGRGIVAWGFYSVHERYGEHCTTLITARGPRAASDYLFLAVFGQN